MNKAVITVFLGAVLMLVGLLSSKPKKDTPTADTKVIDDANEQISAVAASESGGDDDIRADHPADDSAGSCLNLQQVED